MIEVIKYAPPELKDKVLDLLHQNLKINKEVKSGGRTTGILLKGYQEQRCMRLETLIELHEEILEREIYETKEGMLNVQTLRNILNALFEIRYENEVKAYLMGVIARIEVSRKIKGKTKESIKRAIKGFME